MTYQTNKAIAEAVILHNRKIADVANDAGVSAATVRRYMDQYSEEERRSNAYRVYQIVLTRDEVNAVNRGEHVRKYIAQLDTRRGEIPAHTVQCFRKVAYVEAAGLEDVFRIMNLWEDESKVERLADLHSLSVGDVVFDPDGYAHVCAPFGFKQLPENIAYLFSTEIK